MPGRPTDGRIVFVSWRDGNGEVYVMNADGSGQRRLDGARRAARHSCLVARRAEDRLRETGATANADLYVMNADGSGQRRLTRNAATRPAWSPDGRRIAFAISGVRLGDLRHERRRQRAADADAAVDGETTVLAWSPDGRKIAFLASERNGNCATLYVMNADGSGQRNLTRRPAAVGRRLRSAWSPDGRKIAFVRRDGDSRSTS